MVVFAIFFMMKFRHENFNGRYRHRHARYFLYDSRIDVENGFKLILPSPTIMGHKRIQKATRARDPILLTGQIMDGGPNSWAVKNRPDRKLVFEYQKNFVYVFMKTLGKNTENLLDILQTFIHNGFIKKPKRSNRMTTFTVKNIPTDIYDLLKQSAATNRRSINSEIIVCIEKSVSSRRIEVAMLLARARKIRKKTRNYLFTEDEIIKAKLEGRP